MSEVTISAKPVQLIINGVTYPHTSHDKYSYDEEPMGQEFQAVDGTYYYEERGRRSVVTYSYDYFDDELRQSCLAQLRTTGELTVSYLNDRTNQMVTEQMFVSSRPKPTYAFGRTGKPYWHNYSFVLKGVYPLA